MVAHEASVLLADSIWQMGLAFVPPKILKRVFPPHITGLVVLLIGASLVGKSGFVNWAGGSNACRNRPETGYGSRPCFADFTKEAMQAVRALSHD